MIRRAHDTETLLSTGAAMGFATTTPKPDVLDAVVELTRLADRTNRGLPIQASELIAIRSKLAALVEAASRVANVFDVEHGQFRSALSYSDYVALHAAIRDLGR